MVLDELWEVPQLVLQIYTQSTVVKVTIDFQPLKKYFYAILAVEVL